MRRPLIKRIVKNFVRKQLSGQLAFDSSQLRFQLGVGTLLANRSNYHGLQNLWDAEVSVFSQWGEDGIIDFLLQSLNISKPRILEIGAGDFSECNSRFTLQYRNCSAYLVDSNPELKNGLTNALHPWKSTSHAETTIVTPKNVQEIFYRAHAFMGGVDLLSIDIDSIDYWVAQEIPFRDIKIAIFEYNPNFGATRSVTIRENENRSRFEIHPSGLVFGASLRAWIDFMSIQDFIFVGTNRIGNNAFFVKSDLVSKVHINLPNTSDLSAFVDWRIRDTRTQFGKFDFKTPSEARAVIAEIPLWDLNLNLMTHLR